jgi:hypothetical protein
LIPSLFASPLFGEFFSVSEGIPSLSSSIFRDTVIVALLETFPDRSVWVTTKVAPFGWLVDSVQEKLPFAKTTVVHKTFPELSLTIIVAFGSPLPVTKEPLLGLIVGAVGAVVSTEFGEELETELLEELAF